MSLNSFPLINVSSGTNFVRAWAGCAALTSVQSLDLRSMTFGQLCFDGVTLPTSVYDSILNNLAQNNTASNVLFHGGLSRYSSSAQVSRDALVSRGWTITDGGSI